ncbi:hypothetical protein IJT93_08585 [bacterium]|nr:hypothetical protein [bacterium]
MSVFSEKSPIKLLALTAASLTALSLVSACTMDVGRPKPGPQITEETFKTVQPLPPIWDEPLTRERREAIEQKQKTEVLKTLPYACRVPKGWLRNTVSSKGLQYTEFISPPELNAKITVYPFTGGAQKEPEMIVSALSGSLFHNVPQLITADIVSEKVINTADAQIFSRRFNAILEMEPTEWIAVLSCAVLKDKNTYAVVLSVPQSQSGKALSAYEEMLNSFKAAENK